KRVVDEAELAQDCRDRREGVDADRRVRQRRMQRMARQTANEIARLELRHARGTTRGEAAETYVAKRKELRRETRETPGASRGSPRSTAPRRSPNPRPTSRRDRPRSGGGCHARP